MPVKILCRCFAVCSLLLLFLQPLSAQFKKKKSVHKRTDSALIEINTRISDSLLQEKEIKDTSILYLVNKTESYSFILNRAYAFSNKSIDTAGLVASINKMDRGLKGFKTKLAKSENDMNLRNFNTILVLLGESIESLQDWDDLLYDYNKQLKENSADVKKVLHDSTLRNPSVDSVLHGQLSSVMDKAKLMDSIQAFSLIKIKTLRSRVAVNLLLGQDLTSEINARVQAIRKGLWKQEEPALPNVCTSDYDRSFMEIITEAFQRSSRVLVFYTRVTWDTRSINLAIWFVFLIWFLINVRRIRKKETNPEVIQNVRFLTRSAILSSLILLLTYGPFVYMTAPMAYMHLNELLRLFALTLLLFPYLTRISGWLWLAVCAIWIYYAIDDLLLDSAYGERWWLLITSLALTGICIYLFRKKRAKLFKGGLDESKLTQLIALLSGIQIAVSLIANFTGRLTLSKILGESAIQGLVLAMTLQVFCTILLDAVYIQSESFRNSRFSSFLNFIELKNKLRTLLSIFAWIIWLFALLKNLSLFDPVYYALDNFFGKQRAIGSIKYTYSSVLVFMLIIYISSVLSQFVNFFFDHNSEHPTTKRSRLGSINLIIRIAIWTAGFLIAVAAAGIPINKISILLGALGVGIGFGLQNLVNNLVSGIILAFEHPIQIGDLIEVGGRTGTVQEIGVRSSKINNGEGANIIVPNGDLLSQQLINWTLENRNRRIKIMLAVPFKADIKRARELIEEAINSNKRIMHDPPPGVTVDSFAGNAVNFEILVWASDLSQSRDIRNDIMLDIFALFSKNEINMNL